MPFVITLSLFSNIILFAATYSLFWYFEGVKSINWWAGLIFILASFFASLSLFIGYLRSSSQNAHSVNIPIGISVNTAIFLLLCAYVDQSIGVMDTTADDDIRIHSVLDSLYFSIVTFTTLGYGDFRPTSDLRIIAAIQALLGYIYLGLFVVSINKWLEKR